MLSGRAGRHSLPSRSAVLPRRSGRRRRARPCGGRRAASSSSGSAPISRRRAPRSHSPSGSRTRIGAAVGVHPHDAVTLDDAAYDELAKLARGARGRRRSARSGSTTTTIIRRATCSARRSRASSGSRATLKKPIVIHTRSAPADTLDILEREGARDVGGVIHCFSEDRPFAERALDLGFDVSFSGIVTFKTPLAVQEVARVGADRSHSGRDRQPVPRARARCAGSPASPPTSSTRRAASRSCADRARGARRGDDGQRAARFSARFCGPDLKDLTAHLHPARWRHPGERRTLDAGVLAA